MGQLTHTRHSDGVPDPDETLKDEVRIKIRHYHNVYLNRPDPITFVPLAVDTTVRLYDDFIRFLFSHVHREASALVDELSEESDQFRFLRTVCFTHLKERMKRGKGIKGLDDKSNGMPYRVWKSSMPIFSPKSTPLTP